MTTGPGPTDDLPQTPESRPASPVEKRLKRWRAAFYASLAVNLLVLGVVGGAILKGPPPRMQGGDPGLGAYAEALDEADRKALRQAFRGREASVREVRAAMAQEQRAVIAALRATPFAADALDAALERQRGMITNQITLGQQILRDRLVAMTDAERSAFATRLEHSQKRKRDPHREGEPRKE